MGNRAKSHFRLAATRTMLSAIDSVVDVTLEICVRSLKLHLHDQLSHNKSGDVQPVVLDRLPTLWLVAGGAVSKRFLNENCHMFDLRLVNFKRFPPRRQRIVNGRPERTRDVQQSESTGSTSDRLNRARKLACQASGSALEHNFRSAAIPSVIRSKLPEPASDRLTQYLSSQTKCKCSLRPQKYQSVEKTNPVEKINYFRL